jgi:hypothetical protein
VKASKREKKASIKERAEPKFDTVLDILYYDTRRIGLFISQLDDFGLLKQIEFTETTTESSSDKGNFSLRVGPRSLRVTVGKEGEAEETGTDSSKRIYDPFWVIPLSFLDYIEERGLAHNNIKLATIGRLVLLRGKLIILDVSLLKNLWKIPEGKENALQAALQEEKNKDKDPSEVERDVNVFFQMAEHLPHAIQCLLITPTSPNCWGLLNEEFITCSSSDLALKYGVAIDGDWSLLGIVDAKPEEQSDNHSVITEIVSAIKGNAIGVETTRVAEVVRQMGRPAAAFGLTPLLIFRQAAN